MKETEPGELSPVTPTKSKTPKSRKNTGDKSSSRMSWGMTYLWILGLICMFFIAGVCVGSLMVNSDSSSQTTDSSRSVLESTTASKVQSYVSNKGNHLRHADGNAASAISGSISEKEAVKEEVMKPPAPIERLSKPTIFAPMQLRRIETKPAKPVKPAKPTKPAKPAAIVTIAKAVSSALLSDKSLSLHVQEDGFMTGPRNLDNDYLLVTAWIYLDATETNDNDMRTVFSNKMPGCEAGDAMNGIAMFVNAWQSSDHRLYVEYGGENSGCNKLSSPESVTLRSRQWYHVGVYLGSSQHMLLIDGKVVAQQSPSDVRRIQSQQSWLVGRYTSQSGTGYPLYGNVSSLAVAHLDSSSASADTSAIEAMAMRLQQYDTAKASSSSSSLTLKAFYPFEDANHQVANSVAHDLVNGFHGKYSFLLSSTTIGGVGIKLIDGVGIKLIDGVGDRPVTKEMIEESDRLGRERREKVKDGMRHAWQGYKRHAWGKDELTPVSNGGKNNWGGIGMTLVDSLDTLWIMGLKIEFQEARDWVASSLSFDHAGTVSVFEITIRMLGGLLAAFDLSQDRVFLDKAKNLGGRLIKAFNTRSGIPTSMVHLQTGSPANGWAGNTAILSELGTLQVEFRYLAQETGDGHYETTSMKPVKLMTSKNPSYGLYPIKVRIDDGGFADSMITFGALGDSFYEYLLKLWIQGGRKEKWLRDAYDKSIDGAISKLLLASSPSGLAFLSDWNGRSNFRKMDHLVCFMPGLLALGAYTDPLGKESGRAKRDLAVAKALMYTCREMYHRQLTGIAPEFVEFPQGRDMVPGSSAAFYILRPETSESLFILNQLTGDPIYREWAWEIWSAIDRRCRTNSGYASIPNVNSNSGHDDRMESFFLAETIKYLYLAQDPDKPIDLMEYVFNTEAHPMKILKSDHKPTFM